MTPGKPIAIVRQHPPEGRGIVDIKNFGRADIGVIKKLWEGLRDHHLERSTHFVHHFAGLTFEKRMAMLTGRDRFILFVAEADGESVGYCVATVEKNIGEVDSLFVRSDHRSKGFGETLVLRALEWLREQNCDAIRIYVARGNEEVLDFYRRFGFAERFIVMQKVSP